MEIQATGHKLFEQVEQQLKSRAYRASNELRNASQFVLRGQRTGRVYRVPFTKRKYTASAPGEPPANRTGVFRASWRQQPRQVEGNVYPAIETVYAKQAEWLDKGTARMKPRPFSDPIKARAMPAIRRIYKEPYILTGSPSGNGKGE